MKHRRQVKVTFGLTLNVKEAEWLRAQVQNPINFDNSQDEPDEDIEMRNKLWSALDPNQKAIE